MNVTQEIPYFMRNYGEQHNVSPWAVIVDSQFIKKMEVLCREIPIVLHKILRHYAEKNPQYLADYFGIPEVQVALFAKDKGRIDDNSIRFDAIVKDAEVSIIEINSGGSLGGWQHRWVLSEVLAATRELKGFENANFKYRDILEELFKSYCQTMVRLKGHKVQGNILFFIPNGIPEGDREDLVRQFTASFEQVKPANLPNAKLHFFNACGDLQLDSEGRLLFNDEEMDALILSTESSDDVDVSFCNMMESASQKGRFYYPDALKYSLLGNKLLFALAHEQEVSEFLSVEQINIIKRYVPWSTRLNSPQVTYQGHVYNTEEFVINNKNDLLFKKAYSMQGKDVVIGCSLSDEEWLSFYQQHKEDSGWLLQTYVAPDPVPLADPKNGFNLYRIVWGIFALQGQYAGSFLRGMPEKSDDTVINSARGATEFLVLEEQAQKNMILL